MKRIVFAALAALIAFPAVAEIRRADMDKRTVVSEGSLVMTQVDIVSLYLTSEKIAYEPRMGYDKINVDVTVLSRHLAENRSKMNDLISRQTQIFKREVARRVANVAPSVAEHFDADHDIVFNVIVKGRTNRTTSASEENEATYEDVGTQARSSDTGLICNDCPSLIRKK